MKASIIPILAIVLVAGCVGQSGQTGTAPSEPALSVPDTTGLPAPSEGQQTSPSPTTAVKEFNMTIFHTSYEPNNMRVKKGDTVRILAKSAAGTGIESPQGHNHGIAIDEYGIDEAAPSEVQIKTIEFVANKAGTFTIYCRPCWFGPYGKSHPGIQASLVVE